MASSYTSRIRLEKPGTGEQSGTWGGTANTDFDLIDASFGLSSITHDDTANYTLTANNGSSDEARAFIYKIGGTLTAARNAVVPTASKIFVVHNNTTGGYAVTVKTSGGSGVSVANGKKKILYCDGTDVVDAATVVGDAELEAIAGLTSAADKVPYFTGSGTAAVADFTAAGRALVDDADATAQRATLSAAGTGVANTFTANQTITSTDAGATGPVLTLYHNSASPAANDGVGYVHFDGEDAAGDQLTYAKIFGEIVDTTNGSEDGRLAVQTTIAGSLSSRVYVGNGVYGVGATGGDQGANTANFSSFYDDGVLLKPHVQDVIDADSAVATGTTVMPADDTIPQNTEGDEYLSVAITPKNTNNILVIDAVLHVSVSAGTHMTAGLFQDSTAGALAGAVTYNGDNTRIRTLHIRHRMTAGTTSSTTFKVRAGPSSAATMTFNGEGGARLLGGVISSYIHIREFIP